MAGDNSMTWLRTSARGVADAIARCEAAGDGHITPLLRAMGAGDITIVSVPRGDYPISMGDLRRAPAPPVVIFGDDDFATTGPRGFLAARKVLAWVRWVLVHASGAAPEHYEMVGAIAQHLGSAAIVETDEAHAVEWINFATRACAPRRFRGLMILPSDGPHPRMPEKKH